MYANENGNVFTRTVLTGDTIFMSPTGDEKANYAVI